MKCLWLAVIFRHVPVIVSVGHICVCRLWNNKGDIRFGDKGVQQFFRRNKPFFTLYITCDAGVALLFSHKDVNKMTFWAKDFAK